MKLENSKVDIYLQIKNHFEHLIRIGALLPGEPLPSLRKVAVDLGVNPNTVDKGYRLLESEGYIDIFPKKGAYVKEKNICHNNDDKKIKILLKELSSKYTKEELEKKVINILGGIYD